eukprot:TRINITY_DN45077_c0_g1_i2.p1 TRINITY_DN45077_c0_g1~~TRINITY_DN45077_c0_g1_i2.p1  ORF type:complete len:237 (-),score=82.77 TRINITY_DN45077_c0_g1_i2:227-937(-)
MEKLGGYKMSQDVIMETGCGIELNKLRKNADDAISRTASAVRKKLMIQLQEAEKQRQAEPEPQHVEVQERPKIDLRAKVREMMIKVFGEHVDASRVGTDIEQAMYDKHVTKEEGYEDALDDAAYKGHFKTLKINLSRNEELRGSLLDKNLTPEELVRMKDADMASKEQTERLDKLKAEAWKDAQVAQTPMDETDQFQCGKCKKKRCIYFQKQTRSADEPMTTFIKCQECGHNWKEC